MELTLDFQPLVQYSAKTLMKVEKNVLEIANSVSSTAENIYNLLFDGEVESAFTISALGTMAIQSYNPGTFIACLGSFALAGYTLSSRESLEACDMASEVQIKEKTWEEQRCKNIFNLAMTNIACTALSNFIFDSNTPALFSLAILSAVRILQDY